MRYIIGISCRGEKGRAGVEASKAELGGLLGELAFTRTLKSIDIHGGACVWHHALGISETELGKEELAGTLSALEASCPEDRRLRVLGYGGEIDSELLEQSYNCILLKELLAMAAIE